MFRSSRILGPIRLSPRALVLAAALAIPVFVSAEPSAPASQDPLSGPAVTDRQVPGNRSRFGDADRQGERRGPGMPFEIFLGAVRTLGGPNAPEELQPSPEQVEEIRGIAAEFRDAAHAFREENAEQIEALSKLAGIEPPPGPRGPHGHDEAGPDDERRGPRERIRERRQAQRGADAEPAPEGEMHAEPPREDRGPRRDRGRGGPRGPIDPSTLTPEQQAALEMLRELRAQGPDPEEYRARIWAVLSAEQQDYVTERIERFKSRAEERGGQRQAGEKRRPRGPKPQDNAKVE